MADDWAASLAAKTVAATAAMLVDLMADSLVFQSVVYWADSMAFQSVAGKVEKKVRRMAASMVAKVAVSRAVAWDD